MKISGFISPNKFKKQDKHPDYTGPGKDEQGNEYQFAGWKKTNDKGTFISISVQPKQQRQAPGGYQQPQQDKPFNQGVYQPPTQNQQGYQPPTTPPAPRDDGFGGF